MHVNTAAAINTRDSDPAASGWRNPLNLLILGGILLIAAIAVGTVVTIVSFRQRALVNSERELQNTVLLLTRHFDREISDFENLQKDVIRRMRLTAIDTPEAFKSQLSGEDVHAALRTFVSGSVDASGVNVYDADGQLINSTLAWPVRAVNITDRDYFRELKSGASPDTVVAPIRSRVRRSTAVSSMVFPDGTDCSSTSAFSMPDLLSASLRLMRNARSKSCWPVSLISTYCGRRGACMRCHATAPPSAASTATHINWIRVDTGI